MGGSASAGSPMFKLTAGGASGGVAVGSTVVVIAGISNPRGNADSATLHVSLSGLQFVSAKVDRGSGCTSDGGSGVTCFLDFFNSGLSSGEGARRSRHVAAGAVDAGRVARRERASAVVCRARDGCGELGAEERGEARDRAREGEEADPRRDRRADEGGHTEARAARREGPRAATWSKTAKAGTDKLKLALPAKARKAGHDTLRVTVAGHAKSVAVTLRA